MTRYIFLLVVFLAANSANGEVYKCISPDGKIEFSDRKCSPDKSETEVEIKTNSRKSRESSDPNCNHDILGLWKQTHISLDLNENLMADSSQQWLFRSNNSVTYSGLMEQEFPYECNADIITLNSAIKNDLKIIEYSNSKMIWESLDFGGYIYVAR